jgi:hypothetical protein
MRSPIRTRFVVEHTLADLQAASIPQIQSACAKQFKRTVSTGSLKLHLENLIRERRVYKPMQGIYIWTESRLTWLEMFGLTDPDTACLLQRLKRFGWSTAKMLHENPPDNIKLYNQQHVNLLVKLRKLRKMGMVQKSGNEWAYTRRAEQRICPTRFESFQAALEHAKPDLMEDDIFS